MTRYVHILLLFVGLLLLTGGKAERPPPCEAVENESAMVAKIPGTDWEGCDGTCKWVARENNKFKCVRDQCPKQCKCRVFSRPDKNWDGKWQDEGDWSEDPKEKESSRRYRCWCVKAAS